ncbi:hypothetical protein [Selenomonas ruminantium]|uniref:hypothetical protein n=1 Tax=Selenomonas ruminantium TaxID=971 RepID=UPI0015B7A92F|nr:hypothetical protein [Selenomonas ruminantium]
MAPLPMAAEFVAVVLVVPPRAAADSPKAAGWLPQSTQALVSRAASTQPCLWYFRASSLVTT